MHPTCTSATNHLITSLIIADNFTCKRDFSTIFWYKPCYMGQFARSTLQIEFLHHSFKKLFLILKLLCVYGTFKVVVRIALCNINYVCCTCLV